MIYLSKKLFMRVNWLILSYNRPAPNQIVEVHIKYSENITFTLEVYDPISLVGTLEATK